MCPEKSLKRRPRILCAHLSLHEAQQNRSSKICIWWGFRWCQAISLKWSQVGIFLCLKKSDGSMLICSCLPTKPITITKHTTAFIKHHNGAYLLSFLNANLNIFFLQKNIHIYQLIHGFSQQFVAYEKWHPVFTTTCKNRNRFLI
jgi:hypothetical protein